MFNTYNNTLTKTQQFFLIRNSTITIGFITARKCTREAKERERGAERKRQLIDQSCGRDETPLPPATPPPPAPSQRHLKIASAHARSNVQEV